MASLEGRFISKKAPLRRKRGLNNGKAEHAGPAWHKEIDNVKGKLHELTAL